MWRVRALSAWARSARQSPAKTGVKTLMLPTLEVSHHALSAADLLAASIGTTVRMGAEHECHSSQSRRHRAPHGKGVCRPAAGARPVSARNVRVAPRSGAREGARDVPPLSQSRLHDRDRVPGVSCRATASNSPCDGFRARIERASIVQSTHCGRCEQQQGRDLWRMTPEAALLSGLDEISLAQLVLIAATALITSVIGGVAGYGTGALVPRAGADHGRGAGRADHLALGIVHQYQPDGGVSSPVDGRRALIVLIAAVPTCALGPGDTPGLAASARFRDRRDADRERAAAPLDAATWGGAFHRGLAVAPFGWGPLAGGTVGAGSSPFLVMAAGLEGAAVVATDAVISIGIGVASSRPSASPVW